MRKYLKVIFWGLLCWSWQAGAEIYKWRDEKGIMNYSDTPPQTGVAGAQKIKAATVPSDTPLTHADAYHREDAPAKKPVDPKQEAAAAPSKEAEDLKALQERVKAQNCASARTNYRNYAVGGRMQNVNENGQKEYMNDEQMKEGLAKAQQDIDENCPTE